MCEVLATAGAKLEQSEKSKARLNAAFRQLERMSGNTKVYPSRIRFVMRDVMETRAQHWVARRETFTVRMQVAGWGGVLAVGRLGAVAPGGVAPGWAADGRGSAGWLDVKLLSSCCRAALLPP